MVHRLWAVVCLADTIAWQESWAHPAAFGFRAARSALDGAALTHVLLELCRLRRWAVVEMSIDDVKGTRSCWPWHWSSTWTQPSVVPSGPWTSSSAGPSTSPRPWAAGRVLPIASSKAAPCR